uniref:Uncharacterized protein n=1 Tax=Plectus sambesii TaxID=2011161 RepID=A0A914USJ2_9BILA
MDLEALLTLRPSNSNASHSRSSTPRLCRAASRSREGSVASSVGTSASTSSSRRSRKRRKISQRSFIAEAEDENDDDEDTDYREPAESAEEVSPSRVRRKSTRAKRVVGKHYESWKRQAARWEEGEDESRQQRRPVFLERAVDTWLDRVASRTFNARRLYHMARECGQVVCNYVSERLALTFEQRKINLKSDAFVGLRQHLTRFDSRQSDPNRFLTLSANHERLAWSDRWREFFLPYTSMREAHDQRDPPCVAWYCRKFVAGLRQAVLNENWQFVGRQIGSYELTMIRKRAPGADTARTFRSSRNQRYACIPYLPLIWRTGLQRLLQHRLDTDITAKLITEFLVTLIQVDTANKSTQRHRVTIQLSFVDVIVWLIAKEEYELAEHAIVNAQQ